jgi:Transcription factor WhiB
MTPYLRNRPGSVPDAGTSEWMDYAACRSVDPELFFPDKGGTNRGALMVCDGCPVTVECLEYAISLRVELGQLHGVWGGKPERWFRDKHKARRGRALLRRAAR